MTPIRSLCACLAALALSVSTRAATTLVDDTFADASSRNQNIAANSLNVFDGRTGPTGTHGGTSFTRTDAAGSMQLNLNTSTSSQGAWMFFTGAQTTTSGTPPVSTGAWSGTTPLSLQVGDTLTCTETFTMTNLKSGQDIRVGLWDSGGTRNTANGTGGQNDASFSNDLGYGLDFFLSGGATPFYIGKRDLALASSLSALNNPFLNMGAFPALPAANGATMPTLQTLVSGTPYTLTLSIYRRDTSSNLVTATVTGGTISGSYRWQVLDANSPQTTFDTFTAARFNGAALADAITFTEMKAVYSPAVPVITAQPTFASGGTTQTVGVGGQTIMSVTASGAGLTYQWRHDNTPIPSANAASLTLANLQLSDTGNYDVVVTNGGGSVPSNAITLTVVNGVVNPAPAIDTQPISQSVNNGTDVTFLVGASGVNLAYQWYKNNSPIAGATSSSLVLPQVQPADVGAYKVVVSNDGGSVASNSVSLAVLSPTLVTSSLSPAAATSGVNPDSPLRITFGSAPSFGSIGLITIYDAATDAVVDTIDASSPSQTGNISFLNGTPYQVKSIGGVGSFSYYPVMITGNTATIYPRNGTLTYNRTYYVKIDPGFFRDAQGSHSGITDSTTWRFTTKAAGPAAGTTFLTVAADGTGDFSTVQGALDSIPNGNTTPTTVFVRKGTYTEIVYFQNKGAITVQGEDRKQSIVAYPNNNNFNTVGGVYHRGVFYGNNVSGIVLTNLTIQNSTPQNGSQAEALILSGNTSAHNIVTKIDLRSFQDTLQLNGQTYVSDSYIEGDVDFIWGAGPAFFSNCDIKILRTGSYFSQIRNDASRHGFVFLNCRLTAGAGVSGTYLARIDPNTAQFPYSEVVWLNTTMGSFVTPAGWLLNNATTAPNVHFWEYNSTNPNDTALDVSGRAPFSKQLTLPTDAQTISDYSTPSFVLGGWTPQMAPLITQQPLSQTVTAGQFVRLTAQVSAIPDATLQWQKNGVPIPSATGLTYTIASVTLADAGNYTLVATNAAGSATSAIATLSLSAAAPTITASPANQSALLGSTLALTVSATGGTPFTYQWNKDNAPISGATAATLVLAPVAATDAGAYTVTVTNAEASATSSPAAISVVSPAASGIPLPTLPAGNFNVTAYGAIPDGATDNTTTIQAAINAARDAGGGTVELPSAAQPYLSGPLTLYSNIDFQIDGGATLQLLPFGTYPKSTTTPAHFLTVSSGSSNVAITGAGTINGDGAPWWAAYNGGTISNRPRIVQVNHADRILIAGIRILNSPQFNLAFNNTQNATVFGVTITAPASSPNTDGIDPAGTHYLIQNCAISVGDDNIAVKAGSVFMGDITIANCAFGSGHGLSVGGQTNAGLDGMVVTNCTFNGTSTGLRLKADATQGGMVQNLSYSNLTMTNVPYPIVFYSYYNQLGSPGAVSGSSQTTPAKVNTWNATPPNPLNATTLSGWRNITIDGLTATGATGYSILWGLPLSDYLISNVTLNNVRITGGAGLEIFDATNVQITGNSSVGPYVTGNALAITGQPQSQSVNPGATATFLAAVVGTSGTTLTPPTYQWTFNGAPLSDGTRADGSVVTGATTPTLTVTGVRAAEAGGYALVATNSLDGYNVSTSSLAPNSIPVSATSRTAQLTIANALATFVASYGLDPATNGAADADPDGDGIPNALEFVLGGNPTVPEASLLPKGSYSNGANGPVLTFSFDRKKASLSAVSSVVEYSTDLSNWTPAVDGQNGIVIITTALDGATDHVTVTIPAPGPRLFARLRATEL